MVAALLLLGVYCGGVYGLYIDLLVSNEGLCIANDATVKIAYGS